MSATAPFVMAFADVMEQKLSENRHKGDRHGWIYDDPMRLLARLREEVDELESAIVLGEGTDSVLREAADVANYAMMIADVAGGLVPKE